MTKAIIHVNRQFIAMNNRDGGNRPVFTMKVGNKTTYATSVKINGPSEMVYSAEPLKCGARAWLQADPKDVELIEPMSFKEAKKYY